MKRFWKTVTVTSSEGHFMIELDGRAVKLPSGKPLITASQPLAEEIAAEWARAPQDFSPEQLPLTRLTSTAQERIALHRDTIIDQLAAYGMNDLLCYRAASPDDLVTRQYNAWEPWLKWAQTSYGVHFKSTAGLIPIDQPTGTLERLRELLSSQSNDSIAALGVIVPALGSLILGLSVITKAMPPQAACETAFVDELWQEEQWGTDDETARRRAILTEDVIVSARFIELCGP